MGREAPVLARESVFSFPRSEEWPGIHWKDISMERERDETRFQTSQMDLGRRREGEVESRVRAD